MVKNGRYAAENENIRKREHCQISDISAEATHHASDTFQHTIYNYILVYGTLVRFGTDDVIIFHSQ